MRSFPAVAALCAVALALVTPVRLDAQVEGVVQELLPERLNAKHLLRLGAALDGDDPDTVWIGHIYDPGYRAVSTIPAGGYGPYHVGRGPNRPTRVGPPYGQGARAGDNGTWDFDRFQVGETDSLQGWWPLARPYQSTGNTDLPDYRRAFMGLDYGNQANYVINQGFPKRTFGVVGVWHRDQGSNVAYSPSDTIAGTNVQPVLWSPTELGGPGSTASAWMGIRSHGDLSHRDLPMLGGTGNPFNASLLEHQGNNGGHPAGSVSVNGTDHNFPGYGSQMDQMLYRDVLLSEGDWLNISFNYSTNMSRARMTQSGTEIGWFDKDPVSPAQLGVGPGAVPSDDGNFISASRAGANAPCDSFMVYVGAPVNDADVTFSAPLFVGGNEIKSVFDPKRRWFSEVLRPAPDLHREILSQSGDNPPTTIEVEIPPFDFLLQSIKDADGVPGNGGRARIVFRVKTNRGSDDENAGGYMTYSSRTRGAAIVDNVVVNGWPSSFGNFETVNAINNDLSIDPLNAWKSTGKPPGIYIHRSELWPIIFADPCGGLDNPNRRCNLLGTVVTAGDHDADEKTGGAFGSNTQDRAAWFQSPTINLAASGNGPGYYNAMGIDDDIARPTVDYVAFFSLYNASLVNAPYATGNFLSVGYQSYPARQPNGNLCWGETRHAPAISFYGARGCFETFFTGAKANGLIRTTNPENRPDSLRMLIQLTSRCFTFPAITSASCSPVTGMNVGTYLDNVSLALIDGPSLPSISIQIWDLINDAFPINSNATLIPAGFDTCGAQVRTGLNLAAQTGTSFRPSIGGDSVVVRAPGGGVRVDLVFRVLPGPGNYVTTGVKSSGVAQRPDAVPKVPATPGDGSWFGTYMANNGAFGTGGAGNSGTPSSGGPGHGGSWNQHVWNSARMDTAEINLFPTANDGAIVAVEPGTYAGMYHEGDELSDDRNKFSTLGILKNRCNMKVPTGVANSTNILCDNSDWSAYASPASGSPSGGEAPDFVAGRTREYTKIIPDGLLTPGSHVEYFIRKSPVAAPMELEMAPDTNFVFQDSEGSVDGHRWQQFGVLPDRWKDGAWAIIDRNGAAPADMLFIDWQDRRGDERAWVRAADAIGASAVARRGAHNGWFAGDDPDPGLPVATNPAIAVYRHGGQPGTIWDMFGIKGTESPIQSISIGSRAASSPIGYQAGKQNRSGPTGEMLRFYYRVLLCLTGDLAGNLGPLIDKSDNDIGMLVDYAWTPGPGAWPRGVIFQGSNFAEGQSSSVSGLPILLPEYFGGQFVAGNYRSYAASANEIVDLTTVPPSVPVAQSFALLNHCLTDSDVLAPVQEFGAAMAAKYADTPTMPNPKIASIYAPSSLPNTDHPMVTILNGWRISSLGAYESQSQSGSTARDLGMTDAANAAYFYGLFTSLGAALNINFGLSQPLGVGEMPNNPPRAFLTLGSRNPFRGGLAKITFGITRRENVELRLYDVAGRLIRVLAHREFDAGSHDVFWDVTNDNGQLVPRGVYFYQLRTPSFVSQKKLSVLNP